MTEDHNDIAAPRADSALEYATDDGAFARYRRWLLKFRRFTSSGDYIPEIDGLRFIAIAAVVFDHIGQYLAMALKTGDGVWVLGARGVELFFVISGFILAVPFAARGNLGAKPVSLKRYFARRVMRLEPPYIASLILLAVIKIFAEPAKLFELLASFGWSAAYSHLLAYGKLPLISVVAWSLEIEVQFYLLMPLFGLIFFIPHRWIRRAILATVMIGAASVQTLWLPVLIQPEVRDHDIINRVHLLNYIQYFFAGLLMADVFVTEWRNAPPKLRSGWFAWGDLVWLIGWPLVGLVLAKGGAVTELRFYYYNDRFVGFLLPSLLFVLYLSMFQSVWARRLMRVPEIAIIGGMCYSIYLLHNSVIQLSGLFLSRLLPSNYFASALLAVVVMVPLVLLICGAFYRFIEQPCMRRDWPARFRAAFSRMLFVHDDETPPSVDSVTATTAKRDVSA